ncbi:hypothetical protein GUJ93_ZPchr0001g31139 [Zizania palustris]|uniref:Enoyl-CoA hydratase/isomerase domain-containing protein n=1 Tax=Zizania palustris TaxID=103762 RepID=A0A8J5V2M7_ZIZPA|nr:hypothetical protein GUJ93_ZPchr0001g31139 [Zizania palustris]
MFYEGKSDDSCLEVVYRMYWLCYHIHSYKKTTVALVNGLVMGGGAAIVAPLKFAVVTEKTVFATPEASVGLHTDCSFSYIHSRLPGYLGEYLALTGARLNAKEMIAAGLATHFVSSEKLEELEKCLLNSNTGDESAVRAVIEDFSTDVQPDEESILNKLPTINKCFSAESVEDILKAFESEASIDGNQWIAPVLKGMRRSSPTALKMTLRSIREGRKQSLQECLKKEFRLTMNTLRSVVTGDVYEGIRAVSIDKDNAPKWNPTTLEEVKKEAIDRVFEPFSSEKELQVPSDDSNRWSGKYEHTIPDIPIPPRSLLLLLSPASSTRIVAFAFACCQLLLLVVVLPLHDILFAHPSLARARPLQDRARARAPVATARGEHEPGRRVGVGVACDGMAVDLAVPPTEGEVVAEAIGGKEWEGEGEGEGEEEGGGCGGEAVVVAAADAEVEGHPYDFNVSGPRNLPPPNWREIIRSSWKDPNYKRMVMACFIQAVYLLELDRQDQKGEEDGLAPKWWKPFKYKVTQTLVDERDGSIYGAVLEWDRSSALSDLIFLRPSGAPRAVLALRGTLLLKPTIKRDLQDDLRFLVWESLKGSVRFIGALEALKTAVERFGSANVSVAGHSLGAGFALQVCKELAKQGVFVECHLFNPPSVSLAMGVRSMSEKAGYLWKKVKASLPLKEEEALLDSAKEEGSAKKTARAEKKWMPHLYVNNSDYICCHYNAPSCSTTTPTDGASDEQLHQSKAREIAGDVVAKLFVTSKGPQKFLEAHGLQQWWSDGMELQLAVYDSKLMHRQLKSLYTSPSTPGKS